MGNEGSLAVQKRPTTFEEIWGNQETIRTLEANLKKKNHSRTLMFSGPKGCGKTTTARVVATVVGATEVEELNIADLRNIDDARDVIASMKLPPMLGGKRVYIMDEVHAANATWENAMLKDLEEPPEWVYFIMCTTEPQKVMSTVKSRAEKYVFNTVSDRVMLPKLQLLNGDVKPEEILERDLLQKICDVTEGVPRDAVLLLDQVLGAAPADRLSLIVKPEEDAETRELGRKMMNGVDIATVMGTLSAIKMEPESIRRALIGYFASIMTRVPGTQNANRAANLFGNFKEPVFHTGRPGIVYQVYAAMARKN